MRLNFLTSHLTPDHQSYSELAHLYSQNPSIDNKLSPRPDRPLIFIILSRGPRRWVSIQVGRGPRHPFTHVISSHTASGGKAAVSRRHRRKKYIALCNVRSDAGDSSGEPVIESRPMIQRFSPPGQPRVKKSQRCIFDGSRTSIEYRQMPVSVWH